jgi:hypothetical protein
MTFGLKNAGATYQRAMNHIFHDLIGNLVEIYINDVMVKSASVEGHLDDLRRVLERTRKFGLRMNPKKCTFGVLAGQFLGFLVHERGIEIGLKSQEAVRTMVPPTTKKELQQLIGKINFVRRFIFNLSGRIEPFMELVKTRINDEFRWGQSSNGHSKKSKNICRNRLCWCHRNKTDHFTYIYQLATLLLLQWWYNYMMAKRGWSFISAEGCWTQKQGTPIWKNFVCAYFLHAPNFAISCYRLK